MTQMPLVTAADCADALLTARRAKRFLVILLMAMLVAQVAIFSLAHYGVIALAGAPATQPATRPLATTGLYVLHYLTDVIDFLAMGAALLLAIVLLLVINLMLVGRLIGVARATSAFIWCMVLALLLFPWQAFMNFPDMAGATFRLPGVLYTWSELIQDVQHFPAGWDGPAILKWARFVGFPVLALIILLVIHRKSAKGLGQAIGEVRPDSRSAVTIERV